MVQEYLLYHGLLRLGILRFGLLKNYREFILRGLMRIYRRDLMRLFLGRGMGLVRSDNSLRNDSQFKTQKPHQ